MAILNWIWAKSISCNPVYFCTMHVNHRQLFLSHLAQTSPAPLLLDIVSAKGNYLYDRSGKQYLDLISGISVCSAGHCHPEIVEAVQKQASTYMHTMVYGELVQAPQTLLAQALSEILPATLNCSYFLNSGSEATEAAIKLAKKHTGRSEIIAHTHAYHGSSNGSLSLMSNEYFTQPYRPLLPNVKFINQNDMAAVDAITTQTAAVIIEPIQGEKGAIPCHTEYLKAIRNRCNETGTLLIFDEIQSGMGRTGTLFAFQAYGVVPDALLLGKALGGGMPMGALIADQRIMQSFTDFPVLGHITTFGGHPVCCAAALAAVQLTVRELPTWNPSHKGAYLAEKLTQATGRAVNGKGLLLSLSLDSEQHCKQTIDACIAMGLFTDWFLFAPDKMRIAPPLTIEYDELDFAAEVIAKASRI